MKNAPDRFRIATLLTALALGWVAISTIFADVAPKTQSFSQDIAMPGSISQDWLTDFAAAGAPLRGDLLAHVAMARAAAALKP
jgi:hypothetical protein